MEDKQKLISTVLAQTLILLDDFLDDTECNVENLQEELLFLSRIKRPIPRLKNYVEEIVPLYNDEQFKSHFRMRRSTFNYILHLIKPLLLRSKPGNKQITPEKQFLVCIWKMATPDSYRFICEKFNIGKASALQCVRRVTRSLVKLAPIFITWPQGDRVQQIFEGFETVSGFPKIIGAIDGTHINIKAHPGSNMSVILIEKGIIQYNCRVYVIMNYVLSIVLLETSVLFTIKECFVYLKYMNI
ncbi:PREDICTED: putative nuclease HARBI1 isoform X2 [Wasmannia auropunctata]|uniref:putative nuclease HARBI1 isoform X2 n=1 Tax=Wasmannia auropunctata TaxID=64793 RepID=UPI0005F0B735|nr:PREDICTED: putative nuclease HARBI1 isoform X2 [Wasmannia auropunctata]